MSKLRSQEQIQDRQSPVFFSINQPSLPVDRKFAAIENKTFDPSSCLPTGLSYPIPSSVEYTITANEYAL